VINFAQLMDRCRPLLEERIGRASTAGLRFGAEAQPGSPDGGFWVRRGGDEVRIPDLASLALWVFGSHKPLETPDAAPTGSPALLADLNRALPLPSLWYGLSYV
jgi:hypothetical protein